MTEAAEKLDAILAQQESLLKQAVAKCMAKVNTEPTSANLRDLKAAQKQLADFQRDQEQQTSGGRFSTVLEAARWIMAEGYLVKERSAHDHIKNNIPRQKDGTYLQKHIDDYARRTWENPGRLAAEPDNTDHKARLVKAMADEREIKVKQLQSNLIDASEEEQRDAAVLLGIRRHLEVHVPDRAKALVAAVSQLLTDDQRGELTARLPEIIENDLDQIADIFDRLYQAGGIATATSNGATDAD